MKRFLGIGVMGVLAVLGACNSSSDAGDCTTLSLCCDQISDSSSKAECEQVVSMNQTTSCQEAQADFTGASPPMCTVSTASASPTTGCGALTACCGTLSSEEKPGCETVASAGDDGICTSELAAFQCPATSSSGGTGCSGLSACCDTLSGDDKESCQLIVSDNDAAVCTTEIAELCPSEASKPTMQTMPTMGSGGSDCSDLSSCCSSLPSTEQSSCQAIVTGGVAADCSAALTEYKDASLCSGSGSSSGSGSNSGSGCSALSSCCSSLPTEEQAGCQAIVSEGSDSTCSAELSAYQTDDLCK